MCLPVGNQVCLRCDASATMRMSVFHTARLLCIFSTCALRICLIKQPIQALDLIFLGMLTVEGDRRRP